MELPSSKVVADTFFPIKNPSLDAYMLQLRTELIPDIRRLENDGSIVWYNFLVHDHLNLGGRVPDTDENLYVHIRLSPQKGLDMNQLIGKLPNHFLKPCKTSLSPIDGIDHTIMKDHEWMYAWKILGEASEFVVRMLEAHEQNSSVPVQHIFQFMHYITNPLGIGGRCIFDNGVLKF